MIFMGLRSDGLNGIRRSPFGICVCLACLAMLELVLLFYSDVEIVDLAARSATFPG